MDHYSPLPSSISSSPPPPPPPSSRRRWSFMFFSLVTSAGLLLALLALLRSGGGGGGVRPLPPPKDRVPVDGAASRGPSHGVSEKSMGFLLGGTNTLSAFPWTNAMLQWQRTAFHFQPPKNWMNDPNAPVFYKGWYHLFYQYNPVSPVWGNISWGHAASRDLIHWLHLPVAMVPDRWYDANGVWTGSATTLPDGQLVILYTGSTNDTVQVQNLAVPEDPSDPLLLRWRKADEANPVLLPPPGVGPTDFRDPTTAWFDGDGGEWRFLIGTKDDRDHAGVAMIYKTKDFKAAELFTGLLHAVPGTGMWECVDFYPVGTDADDLGVDMPATSGKGVRHVLKASLDDDRHDYYAIGTYEKEKGMWVPDDAEADVGLGLRYDWGKFYASKTFYDQSKKRRVLWSWIGETDSELADIRKGWASLQGIPRTVLLDVKTGRNLLQWPVEEVKSLRTSMHEFTHLKLEPQTLLPLNVSSATQLDLEVELDVKPYNQTEAAEAVDVGYNCSTSDGAMQQGVLGPFGLLVLADAQLSEQTAVYFYVAKGTDGSLKTHFCHDEMRSSKANDIYKRVVGNTVPVLDGEKLSLRILVDHSIVESFAQGGRTCITSRVYPTRAIYNSANVFIFNYATGAQVIFRSIKIWQMSSANINLNSLPA